VTTSKQSESPFKQDSSFSNLCGFTLMNSQTGNVVAEVMDRYDHITVTPLPSMIRVDAVGRVDVIYTDISEALGEDEDYFSESEFEEVMSTHYGRMVHEDDRTILFADPVEAAEYIGFDLKPDS
jgi:propane monooxygenase coupling protein